MIGLIPCAGKGSRWGGYYKELLPIGEDMYLIDSSINAMKLQGCNKFCIVTNEEKIDTHARHFKRDKYKGIDVFFVLQKYQMDLWGAILTALPYMTENYTFFSMPDTLFPNSAFRYFPVNNLVIGAFDTTMPERFGIINKNGTITNKSIPAVKQDKYLAWGTFSFTSAIRDLWLYDKCTDYTDALNHALNVFKYDYHVHLMDYYYDFASWKDYREWIKGLDM